MTKFKDAEEWLEHGVTRGWVRGFCATHDIYENADEIQQFDDDTDPCVPVYRIVGLDGNTATNLGVGFLPKPNAKTNGHQETPAPTTKRP